MGHYTWFVVEMSHIKEIVDSTLDNNKSILEEIVESEKNEKKNICTEVENTPPLPIITNTEKH